MIRELRFEILFGMLIMIGVLFVVNADIILGGM